MTDDDWPVDGSPGNGRVLPGVAELPAFFGRRPPLHITVTSVAPTVDSEASFPASQSGDTARLTVKQAAPRQSLGTLHG